MGLKNKSEKAQQNIKTRVSGKRREGCSSRSSRSLYLAAASRPRSMRSLWMSYVTPRNAERVRHPAPDGRSGLQRVGYPAMEGRSSCLLCFFVSCVGCGPRSVLVALLLESCRREVEFGAGASPRCGTSL